MNQQGQQPSGQPNGPTQPVEQSGGTIPLSKQAGTQPLPSGARPTPAQHPQQPWGPPPGHPNPGAPGGPSGAMGVPSAPGFGGGPQGSPGVSFLTLCGVEFKRLWMRRSTKWLAAIGLFFACLAWGLPLVFSAYLEGAPFFPMWAAISAQAAAFMAGFMSLAATSFICAEFATGSMSNWLTFEPRRIRVALAKYVALLAGTAVAIAVSTGVSAIGALALGATDFNSDFDVSRAVGFEVSPGWPIVRLLLVCFGAVLVTACTAMIIRNTSGTIGAFVLWGVVVEGIIAGAFAQGKISKFLPGMNTGAFIAGGVRYRVGASDNGYDPYGTPMYSGDIHEISLTSATIYLTVLLIVFVAGSLALFNRRDVA